MDMNLRLPFGEHGKEDEEPNGFDNLLDGEIKLHNGDAENGNFEDIGDGSHVEDDGDIKLPVATLVDFQEDSNLEPLSGMEFESHGEAYSFYQEYARSMGFNTAIQNSRRSKTSREFIDAKFACSRYGTKREYEKPVNRPRARQVKQEPQDTTGRRSCAKTDCKASMHVKRRSDGKWVIHKFVKEHNHELLPAQAVSEQTRKMYAAMARQFAEYKNLSGLKNDSRSPFDKRSSLVEAGDIKLLLEFFVQMQNLNSNFFYGVDGGDDQRVKNCFWVDGKSRHDYIHFNDIVSFDTTYVRNKYKMPLALFIGVNQHYQFLLLGCALISDESATTFDWLMRTWLRAMGGQAPKVMITEQDRALSSVISEVFPNAFHSFCLWNVLGKVSENLGHVIKRHEKFMTKFEKCINRSWTEEEFVNRWRKIVDRFELREDEWFQLLYEDRKHWVPTYMRDTFLAGMSAVQRSDSVNSFFDKYLHKKTTVAEFLKQYEAILQDRYEEEAKADSDTWNKQPAFKSPSPLEKHMSGIYTHAVFKKFQAEVLGAIACHPKGERPFDTAIEFKVQDVEKNQEFTVTWNESKSEVSCICRLFEYKGYLCRHAMIVLQVRRLSHVPSQYILKRWTRDAKSRQALGDGSERVKSRVQRYDDICQRAMRLGEEASLTQESYDIALRALDEALGNCVAVNNSSKNLVEAGASASHGLIGFEEDNEGRSLNKSSKKKNPTKKKKLTPDPDVMTVGMHENLQHMEKLNSRPVTLDPYYGTQPNMQMVQLNLMGPTRDSYYTNQQSIQGLGQLNSVAPTHDGYYSTQQSMHGLQGQMDFFRTPSFPYNMRDDSNVRSAQLHEDASRHQ